MTAKQSNALRILFIGNSYTYVNDLPHLVEALSLAAGEERAAKTDAVVPGGCTLQRHWHQTGARQAVVRRRYDVVVLQEHSTRPVVDRWLTERYARLFDRAIRKTGAKTMFYLTWARSHLPEMQRPLTDAYRSLARECGAALAPVGEAWEAALRARPGLALHTADHSHPSRRGSYLAACVFYATLYGRSPEGLPARLAVSERGKRRILVSLTRADAAFLQRVAWRTVKKR